MTSIATAEFPSIQNRSRPFEQRTRPEKEEAERDKEGLLDLLNTDARLNLNFRQTSNYT